MGATAETEKGLSEQKTPEALPASTRPAPPHTHTHSPITAHPGHGRMGAGEGRPGPHG